MERDTAGRAASGARLFVKIIGIIPLGLFIILLTVLATLAIYYSNLPNHTLRAIAAGAFALGTLAAFIIFPRRLRTVLFFLAAFVVVLTWWFLIPASNDRDWEPDVAVVAQAAVTNNLVTVRNIRNFDYKSEKDFTVRYYDKTFDLDKLRSVDFFISYWDQNEAIAHTMLSFGFTGGDYLTLSIEIRREKGEDYSGLKGLFKQYEIIYVLGDERDLVRLRTNYRGEDVYLYPTTLRPEETRALFVDIMRQVDKLAEEPAFYRTLGRNCTTSLISHIDAIPGNKVAFHRKILLNGYSDQLAFERGRIRSNLPFNETKRLHFISPIAKTFNDDPEFSHKIRAELRKRGSSM